MAYRNITITTDFGLCLSCEICHAICPENAIAMIFNKGQHVPKVDDSKCIECGLCRKLCPGIDIDPFSLRSEPVFRDTFDGRYIESYTAYCRDTRIRRSSTSGGLVTALVSGLMKNKEYDSAFVLGWKRPDSMPARLKQTSAIKEILASAKSKYIPASVFNVIKVLQENNNRRYVLTALPCQVCAVKKVMADKQVNEDKILFLGLFCDRNLNYNFIRYLNWKYARKDESLIYLDYRTKEKLGWPGNVKIYFDTGRELLIDRSERMRVKQYFQLKRCLVCLDKLNRLADISFGDCYISGEEDPLGKSSAIIRSNKGKDVFDRYRHLFTLAPADMDKIRLSQRISQKDENLSFLKVCCQETGLFEDIHVNPKISKKFSTRCKDIERGKKGSFQKIEWSFKFTGMKRSLKNLLRNFIALWAVFEAVVRDFVSLLFHLFQKTKRSGENIIIVGAQTSNKGAEAMLFTVVNEMSKRFPSKEIYQFSATDFYDELRTVYEFTFKTLPWELATKIKVLNFWGRLLIRDELSGHAERTISNVLKNSLCIIDISGYGLSSQWGGMHAFNHLLNIMIARRYSIPYFVMPQSIGPFDFKIGYRLLLYPLIWLYFKYPLAIFIREKAGVSGLKKFVVNKVKQSHDIVLMNTDFDLKNIFQKVPVFKHIDVKKNAVGIILNRQVFERKDPQYLYSLYQRTVNKLLWSDKNVYFLMHSFEDLNVCKKIRKLLDNFESIHFLMEDYSVFEIEEIIKKFDFIITSRYHSIVHAFKNGVPAVVLGWAIKYAELMEEFDQSDYFFDIGDKFNHEVFLKSIELMTERFDKERNKIFQRLDFLRNEDVFNEVEQIIKKYCSGQFKQEISSG